MNKELYTPLQALNNVRYHFFQPSSIISKDMNEWFEIIETALKKNIQLEEENEKFSELVADLMKIDEKEEKKLKALEIIKEKRVNVRCLMSGWKLGNYNSYKAHENLTQEEFDLLKEVLL